MVQVKLPDGKILEVEQGLTAGQIIEKIGAGLARAAIAVKIDAQTAARLRPNSRRRLLLRY